MMLSVAFPDNCRAERRWISSVLLEDFLGLCPEIQFDRGDTVRISAAEKTLVLPDVFFQGAKDKWLSGESLPMVPLPRWHVAKSNLVAELIEPSVPILFGSGGFDVGRMEEARLGIDVFGAAFFMLSRYEEAASKQRDIHGRFPATASLAYREGFLNRPIVDEYVEILWAAMQRLWPQLRRKQRRFKTHVTCDVDQPYHSSAVSVPRLIKRTLGEIIRKRTVGAAIGPVKNYFASRKGDWRNDPYYYMVDWMMDVNEKAGNKVAFYFIPEVTDPAMDGTCSIAEPAVKAMMKRIAVRGHEIGIHPGYHTYESKKNMISGKLRLQNILQQEQIRQKLSGGRQHYLRWSTKTPALFEAAGLEYDSTLGYADHAGFRSGTCHEYQMFDLHQGKSLNVRQRPLICMERSVINYMGLGWTESALAKMEELKNRSQKFNGTFTLLWHNSSFEMNTAKDLYCRIIGST